MTKLFDYQVLANRFVLKFKWCKKIKYHFPIDILFMVMRFFQSGDHFCLLTNLINSSILLCDNLHIIK